METSALCVSCNEPSPERKYCPDCVRKFSISALENPVHGKSIGEETEGEITERESGTVAERLERHFPQVLDRSQVIECAAVGSGGAMWLLSDRLVVKHFGLRGLLTQGLYKGELTIMRHAITAITFREARNFTVGFLQVDYMGAFSLGQPGRGGAASELDSMGSVAFEEPDQPQFLVLYRALMATVQR